MCVPPYIVFCAVNANVFAGRPRTSALIANAMFTRTTLSHVDGQTQSRPQLPSSKQGEGCADWEPGRETVCHESRRQGPSMRPTSNATARHLIREPEPVDSSFGC